MNSQQFSIIITKATLRLMTEYDVSFINLRSKAKESILEIVNNMGLSITEEELNDMSWKAIEKRNLSPNIGVSAIASRIQDDHWLDDTSISFEYFNRFNKYLQIKKGWINTESLKKDSYSIIQMLGSPSDRSNNHRRGLLIGDVQSGKTASYTAILNRAVDVGYNVIVLLAGALENLRRQTQERIDKELVGYTLDPENPKSTLSVGVGEYKIASHLRVQTTTKNDFTSRTRKKVESRISDDTLLFVIKKNVKALEEVYSALISDNDSLLNDKGVLDASILIIDDEADNASVNTKGNSELDPTRINGGIRRLLTIFAKTSYLAVTATPFANIYIDDRTESEMFGDDLFPSDFIHLLSRPLAYTGAYKLFGDYTPQEHDPISYQTCEIPIKSIDIPENSYCFKHKEKDVVINGFNDFPKSLQESIRYFFLVQYLMDYLPNVEKPHRTMMINVSRFVSIQNKLANAIKRWIENVLIPSVYQWHNYPEVAVNENSGEFYELHVIWNKFSLGIKSGKTWEDICPGMYDSFSRVRVCVENMSREAKEMGRLNYEAYKNGDRVIAVGGQCLSRGLTLENLVVTYFYRNSAAYDTLLQMGRWFGYRDSYITYFKLWMADEAILWYRLVSEACEDLRSQVERMNSLGMEPRQFGLMVRRHPYSGLIITARCKMRMAKKDSRQPVDLNGRLIESPRLWKGDKLNKTNLNLINTFLLSLQPVLPDSFGNLVFSDISKADIYPVVASFDSAVLSIGFRINQLGDYILRNCPQKWDVAIPCNGDGPEISLSVGGEKRYIKTIKRKYKFDGTNEDGRPFIRINDHHVRIGQGNITRIGLSIKQIEDLEKEYKSELHEKTWNEVKSSYSVYLQARKENSTEYRNPLLILYPLMLENIDNQSQTDFLSPVTWGIGIGFPGKKGTKENRYFEYWLNPVAIRQGIGIDEAEEEDDKDESITK